MHLMVFAVTISVLIHIVVCTERRQSDTQVTVIDTSLTSACFEILYIDQCVSTSFAIDAANVALTCGANYLPVAENYAAQCTKNADDVYCLLLINGPDAVRNLTTQAEPCLPVTSPQSSCPAGCRNALQSFVDLFGCCFRNVFNERLSQLIFGHDAEDSLIACNVSAPPACEAPAAFSDLTVPEGADSCDQDEFWARISRHTCRTSAAQTTISALAKNPMCIPLARHNINTCSLGPNDTHCLELFGTSFNPFVPERTVTLNSDLSNVMTSCDNYSSFQSDGCPSVCQDALRTAINEIGCCINIFNDEVNEILLPHFSEDVMSKCGIDFPGRCRSDLRITGSGASVLSQGTMWVYLISSFLLFICSY